MLVVMGLLQVAGKGPSNFFCLNMLYLRCLLDSQAVITSGDYFILSILFQ
jgi:hypothetical protein